MQEKFVINIDVPIMSAEDRFKGKQEEQQPKKTAKERFEEATPKKPKESAFKGQLKAGGAALAAGAAGLIISNVGTFTGSQAAQNKVNNITKVAALGILTVKNPALGLAAIALTMANNAIKIAQETREWNLSETRNSERIGITASQRGRR